MSFQSREIQIRTYEGEDTGEPTYADVEAFVQGLYAYHPSPSSPNRWNVTHVPTCMHLATNMTKSAAREFVMRLCTEGPTLMISAKPGLSREKYMEHPDFATLKKICTGQ